MVKSFVFLVLLFGLVFINAQNFSSTFIQYAYGWNNTDYLSGNNPKGGKMHLVTLDHISNTKWGGVFGFVNYSIAPSGFYMIGYKNQTLDDVSGDSRLYSEICPWVSLPGILNQDIDIKWIKDFSLEGQINVGVNYLSGLIGGGVTFKMPENNILKVMAYWRTDNIKENAAQITTVFDFLLINKIKLRTQGYIDFIPWAVNKPSYGGNVLGPDVISQVRLLWDFGQYLVKESSGTKLELGCDFYIHFNQDLGKNKAQTFVPQVCFRLTIE